MKNFFLYTWTYGWNLDASTWFLFRGRDTG